MKLFALYLPQFHAIKENDEWWGKGFTEWVNVRNAKPLFPGHQQPIAPADGNYYNLLDKTTVQHQTDMMHRYGIDGMVYYHYYFNGRHLLEKPAENLLQWTDIDQPFFFCWANHTWNRAWNGSREVLLAQTYGEEADWRAHFDYLLPFFRDPRYEKKDNKPVFMIYDCSFPEKHAMLDCFSRWCQESGFDGIYVIEECFQADDDYLAPFCQNLSRHTEHIFLPQPLSGKLLTYESKNFFVNKFKRLIYKLRQKGILRSLETYNGSKIYRTNTKKLPTGKQFIHGIFFSWDNTPRHGFRGYLITPPTQNDFIAYMDKMQDRDYMIINAWNEWAEGMVLEPTAHMGDTYLRWIHQWVTQNNNKDNI